MVWREQVTEAGCQGAGAEGVDSSHCKHRSPTGSTAAAAAAGGVGVSRQPKALCVSMGVHGRRGAASPGRVGAGGWGRDGCNAR